MKLTISKKKYKLPVFLLILAMILTLLPLTALAVDYSVPGADLGSSDMGSITISSAAVNSCDLTTTTFSYAGYTNYRYTYNIVLSAQTALNATMTATFTKSCTAGPSCYISPVPPPQQPPMIVAYATLIYNVTLASGSGTVTAYDHHDLANQRGRCDIYIFNYTVDTINNPIEVSGGEITLRFGDPAYPSTQPESLMSFVLSSGYTYNAVYTGSDSGSYYPDRLSLLATPAAQIDRLVGSGVTIATYDTGGNKTTWSTITPAQNINNGQQSDLYTVEIGASGGSLTIYNEDGTTIAAVINFSAPIALPAGGGTAPQYVNGYLPLGQYATGTGWGSVYSSYSNVDGNAIPTAATKVTAGYASTGVSLGSPGGYIQYEFASTGVPNSASNPYGIDFVIYGNPFVGNPEAASVMVSNDGIQWYELAGSRYYNAETMRNTSISYKMIPTATYATDKKVDIYYKIGNAATWTAYKSNVTWWPEYTSEGYGTVSGVGTIFKGSEDVNNVSYAATGNGDGSWIVTYSGVSLVRDTDGTDDYLFGYADIRHVGNTINGTATNPYASLPSSGTSSMSGGDGFDISWAVDPTTKEPVSLSYAKYVRVYTSAALVADGSGNYTILPTPGIFGETSAEVCGAYVAVPSGSSVGTTSYAGISASAGTITTSSKILNVLKLTTVTVPSGTNSTTLTFTSAADELYIKDVAATSGDTVTLNRADGATQYFRVITQTATRQAGIIVVKVVFA
jgi:hypothetical protein